MKKWFLVLAFLSFFLFTASAADLVHGYVRIVGKDEAQVKAEGANVAGVVAEWQDGAMAYQTFFKTGFFVKKYVWVGIFKGPREAVAPLVSNAAFEGDIIGNLKIYLDYESEVEVHQPPVGNPPVAQPPTWQPQRTSLGLKFTTVEEGIEFFTKANWGILWNWLRERYWYEYHKHEMGRNKRVNLHVYDGDRADNGHIVSLYF